MESEILIRCDNTDVVAVAPKVRTHYAYGKTLDAVNKGQPATPCRTKTLTKLCAI